jgi:hypothetical protein
MVAYVLHTKTPTEPRSGRPACCKRRLAPQSRIVPCAREHPISRWIAAMMMRTVRLSDGQARAMRSVSTVVGRLSKRRRGAVAPLLPRCCTT